MAEPLSLDGAFVGRAFHLPVRVYFEDTDLSCIVYHANYLRFMERGRSAMLRAAGVDQRAAQEAGEGVYAVRDIALRYHAPAKLDDLLTVVTRVVRIRAAAAPIAVASRSRVPALSIVLPAVDRRHSPTPAWNTRATGSGLSAWSR
jgi:tol-pal system-associated acyl-CoA thioesterase